MTIFRKVLTFGTAADENVIQRTRVNLNDIVIGFNCQAIKKRAIIFGRNNTIDDSGYLIRE